MMSTHFQKHSFNAVDQLSALEAHAISINYEHIIKHNSWLGNATGHLQQITLLRSRGSITNAPKIWIWSFSRRPPLNKLRFPNARKFKTKDSSRRWYSAPLPKSRMRQWRVLGKHNTTSTDTSARLHNTIRVLALDKQTVASIGQRQLSIPVRVLGTSTG